MIEKRRSTMSEIDRIRAVRIDYWIIFYVLGLVFIFPLQQIITLGAGLYFSWGYVIWVLIVKLAGYLLELPKFSDNLLKILLIILTFGSLILFTFVFTRSLLWLNTRQAKSGDCLI